MLEEIADSMTLGGRLAALVGLVAALVALVLRLREYRQPPSRPGTRDAVPSPVAPPVPVAPPKPNDEQVAAGETPNVDPAPVSPERMPDSSPPDPGAVSPGSLFKSYVPPDK